MKLIDKDAVLAVIDKFKHEGNIPYDRGLFELVCDIESDINSLEVKEVELDKPFKGISVNTSFDGDDNLDTITITTKYYKKKGE